MYLIKSNNKFYLYKIYDFLSQKKIPILLDNNKKVYGTLKLEFFDKSLKVQFNEDNLLFDLPLNNENFFHEIYNLLSENFVQVGELTYYPIKELISKKNVTVSLRNTHNLIFNQALINNRSGVLKLDLYNLIWPSDIDIHINKLDTHLTNLKNFLKKELNYDLKFISNHGMIQFLLD